MTDLLQEAQVWCQLLDLAVERDHPENFAYFLAEYKKALAAINKERS